jgi:hypothetical protein
MLLPMSRPLRIEFPGACYHVTARGDRREAIYEDDEADTSGAIQLWPGWLRTRRIGDGAAIAR